MIDGDQVDVAGVFCQDFCCLSNLGGVATYNVVYIRYGLVYLCRRVGLGCVRLCWTCLVEKEKGREGEVEETLYSRACWAMRQILHALLILYVI